MGKPPEKPFQNPGALRSLGLKGITFWAMGKKKKKAHKTLAKRIKKVIVQRGDEIALGLATGIVTNFITDAAEKFFQPRKTKAGNKS